MKLSYTSLCLFLTCLLGPSVRATEVTQGLSTFIFSNWDGRNLDAPVFDAEGNGLFGPEFVAMLYGGATPDALLPALVFDTQAVMPPVPFTVRLPNGDVGYFSGPIFTTPGGSFFEEVTIQGSTGFEPVYLQVRAWDLRLGATYEDVSFTGLGGYGESEVFSLVGGNPALEPPSPPKALIGLESFSLHPVVPEPSTITLGLMSLPLLFWMLRRRR